MSDQFTVMRGLIDCVRCGRSPSKMFMKKTTGQHYCKACLDVEYKKSPAVKLVGVKEKEVIQIIEQNWFAIAIIVLSLSYIFCSWWRIPR